MKRLILTLLLLIATALPAYAEMIGFEGGVIGDPNMKKNTYNYQEVFFLSGEPKVLTGTVTVPAAPEGKETYTLQYSYTLTSEDETVTLSRKVTAEITEKANTAFKQTQYKAKITKYQEDITVDGVDYSLDGYLFTKSLLFDNTPAVDYFSGNLYGKRTYYIGGTALKNKGKITVETTGDTYIGYKHHWGSSNTAVIRHTIQGEKANPDYTATGTAAKTLRWDGLVTLKLSTTDRKTFELYSNSPQTISFRSGYILNEKRENIMQYQYDLPKFDSAKLPLSGRNTGEKNLRWDMQLDSESLLVPKFRDIGNHWAEQSIFLTGSLKIFNNDSAYFSPDTPITRGDYANALANALTEIAPLTTSEKLKLKRDKNLQKLFEDITVDDPNYPVVRYVKEQGIMKGENSYFLPDRNLRRAEAIEILINALGISHMAPSPPFSTGYLDDEEVPNYARNSVYMAKEIGLVTGFEDGYLRPNDMVTRAEAAVLVEKFINHIRQQINYDYREKIINNL